MDPLKLTALCRGKQVWIQTHNVPDPDAISSAFGLQEFLRDYGISSEIFYFGTIDKLSSTKLLSLCGIRMNSYEQIRERMKPEDLVILVDCQRGTGNTSDTVAGEQAVIDHHPVVSDHYVYADLRITGSCASIIASYYQKEHLIPSEKAATALLYGLKMDTFQFSRGVTAFDIGMFGFLFEYADHGLLKHLETNNMELSDLKAYGTAIENIEVHGCVGFSYVDFICPDALVAILSDFLLSLEEVDVVIVYALRAHGVKLSVRSMLDEIHAGALAERALAGWSNAGGHAAMAGGTIPEEIVSKYGDDFPQVLRDRFLSALQEIDPSLVG